MYQNFAESADKMAEGGNLVSVDFEIFGRVQGV